jgi:two-component system, NtrC family, sensor kinase
MEMIELAVQKGESLTKKLLSFSRQRAVVPQVIDLAARITALRGVLTQSIRGDIALELHVPHETIAVRVDPSEFEIALLNLTLNARDAMPDGGRIVVTLERVSERGRLPNDLDGAFAAISVADSGSGIAEEIREHIFEPFFTTKPMDKGTGLGLSQVYGFVSQAHGAVVVDSKVGRGSVFTLYLPIVDETPETASPPVVPEATRLERKRVLLVEDNIDVAAIATEYLEQCGCDVTTAVNAAIAVATLNERHDIDIVFSDIAMPGMNGLELARLVRDHHPEIGIVLASGYSEKAAQAVREGFRVIEKPYSADAMQQSLMAVARR